MDTPRPPFLVRLWPPLPVWKRLDAAVLTVVAYALIVKAIIGQEYWVLPKWFGEMSVVNGILLGVLLGFRNLQAYDRWWEARKLWGQLINDSRNLCVKMKYLVRLDPDEQRHFGRLIAGFAFALRNHLRGGRPLQTIPGFEKESAHPTHVPLQFSEWVYDHLQSWRKTGQIDEFNTLLIDPHAKALMDICGACERIKSSPVPLSYRALLRHGTIFYLITAPWFMAGEYGYLSVGLVALLGYFLLGIEFTAEDVEEPFGKDGDDLELSRFCDIIRKSCEQVVGGLDMKEGVLSAADLPNPEEIQN